MYNNENNNPSINLDNNNSQVNNPDQIDFPTCPVSAIINPLSQKKKNKKQKKNKKLCSTSKETDIKRSVSCVSSNIDNDFQSNNEPYNKLIGFEICTNSGRFQKFGYGKDEQLKYCHEIKNKERVVVGFNNIKRT